MDETSINKVLEYGKLAYDNGRYEEAKLILRDFYRMSIQNKKNAAKVILALWLIYSINFITGNWNDLFTTFVELKSCIDLLKDNLEEEFKKINVESVRKLYNISPKEHNLTLSKF